MVYNDIEIAEIDAVLRRSQDAFLKYKLLPGKARAKFLNAIALEIEKLGEDLIEIAIKETSLSRDRLMSERTRTCNQLRQFATLLEEGSWVDARIDIGQPDRKPLPKPDIRKLLVPIGPVVVFGASNFPYAYSTAGTDTAAALAAGCSVVLKGHPAHAGTSELVSSAIGRALEVAGVPPFTFQHVHGAAFEVGKKLVQHPLTKAVGFTGSFTGGMALYNYAVQRPDPIPVFSEMGSINPIFILPESLQVRNEQVAEMCATSITQSVGQFCTNPGLMLGIQSQHLTEFSRKLSAKISDVIPATMLHPGIASSFDRNRQRALKQKGVVLEGSSKEPAKENQATPTLASVAVGDFLTNPVLFEEVFGPYSLLVKATTMEELKAAVDKLPGQLTATIIGEEDELVQHADIVQLIMEKAGRVIINGVPTGVEVCASMHHGGPFPATTDSRFTSVGTDSIKRFVRPLSFQNFPEQLLPDELKTSNPLGIWRLVNNELKK